MNTGKADNYEKGLKKAEGRIAWLQKQLEIGPHAAFNLETPTSSGVSKKNYIKIIQEYLKLQKTLNHIQLTGLTRDEIALKNREMYEMLIKLRVTEIKELLLEKKRMERTMEYKQLFAEKLVKENEFLKNLGEKNHSL